MTAGTRRAADFAALARSLPTAPGHFDEWREPDGTLRRPWRLFAEHAGDLGPDALLHAERRVARQIAENGVTYTVYGGDLIGGRPWGLDVLPTLVEGAEWDALSIGLRQYGRALDAIARDLYGDRRLLESGALPSDLVFPHAGFLRACQGVRPPGGVFLHTLALDLARDGDGTWRVVGVRAQAPSGLGYALENRATIARVFPEAMRDLHARPLMPFCDALQEALLAMAPCETNAPQLVLLTPGRFSETYFEHVYLARQLGVPLVEGGDLTVRHDRVFLKTVSGLQPVHAIWRRLDDDYSDPLELKAESTLGVPGLVQAWRAGHVLVANAFGLSVLESPALLSVLPDLAVRVLGEPLTIPVAPTIWPTDRQAIALDHMVIKPALSSEPHDPIFGHTLGSDAQRAWAARMSAEPSRYVAQQYIPLSQAPVSHGGAIESRGLIVRAFLLTDGRGDYHVLPGGLSRITGGDRANVSGQRGGGSKDTWIVSAGPTDPPPEPSPWPRRQTLGERATPSRVAEHLFWLGRYAERSENMARLLRAVLTRVADAGVLPSRLRHAVVRTCRGQGLFETTAVRAATITPREMDEDESGTGLERALVAGISDHHTRQSLGYNVAQLDRVAGSVRDRLSSDNWRVLHRLFQQLTGDVPTDAPIDEALEALDQAILSLVAIGGLEMAHMTRDDGWRFLSLGRHIERLAFVATTLDDVSTGGATEDPSVLEWLLDLSDSLITYRARHARRPEWTTVMDLLLFDERNPRSVMFQVGKMAKHVRLLPDANLMAVLEEIDVIHAAGHQRDTRQRDLFGGGMSNRDQLSQGCQRLAARVSDALTHRYFSHVYELPRATVTA
ncbi:MAG: circularly permuted type 2 ATP-grasp protein [Acidobacteriota bacterium]